jgi:arylsulfatase A-like enzyme
MTESRARKTDGLVLALVAGIALLAVSGLRWLDHAAGSFESTSILRTLVNGPILGTRLGGQIASIGAAHVAVHGAFGFMCWVLAILSGRAWPSVVATRRQWTLLWLMLGTGVVLVLNAGLYPRTSLGDHLEGFARLPVPGGALYQWIAGVAALAVAATILAAAWRAAVQRWSMRSKPRQRAPALGWASAAGVVLAALSLAVVRTPDAARQTAPAGTGDRPHVILIGLDSLRCDQTLRPTDAATPAVDRFLTRAVHFTDATTPLARTFPSWVSLLTGQHPHTTGAFVNLLHDDQMTIRDSLPLAMRRAGYATAYAIDEVRFSNIDASYGFDQTITPPIGAADFIAGLVSDAPLSNVVTNTALGRWLFPFAHANRAIAHLYDPDRFVARVNAELEFDRPTFLGLHLTLAHWPYLWGDQPFRQGVSEDDWVAGHYAPAVRRLDQQFDAVMAMLERKGALQNAIVIVFSDHGEALGKPDDSPWALSGPVEDPYAPQFITGHGTSVLSPHQYRVLLSFRAYGRARLPGIAAPRTIDTPASLEDVAPTLDDLLDLGVRNAFDGRSLRPILEGDADAAASLQQRFRFTETEFNPRGFMPGEKASTSDIEQAIRSYEIDPRTGRLNIRRSERANLLKRRQYAAMRGSRLVAAVPGLYTPGFRYVALDTRGGLPSSLGPDAADHADPEVAALLGALRERFAEPLGARRGPTRQ